MSPASGPGAGGGRRVTIRSMSCRGVKAFVPFQKPPLYAAVSLGGRRQKTPPDADGGENPDWEGAVVAFDLGADGPQQQEEQQLLQFEVKAQVPLLGTKLVGTASVPVADLAPAGDGAALRHVSYQVRAPDGKPNGTLSFAYAFGSAARPQPPQLSSVPDVVAAPPQQNPTLSCAPPPLQPPVTAYPAPSSTANFSPHGGGYRPAPSPPGSASLYPSLHDLLPSTLPHLVTMTNPHFPEPNSITYPPPPEPPDSVYPPPVPNSSAYSAPPPESCTPYPAPPVHYISSSYPPQPPSSYPPPPPGGYPPPTGTYPPPPPPPESGSAYPVLPSPSSRSVDRDLPYNPPGGSLYPAPLELDGAARAPYYYPPPGPRYA